MIFHSTPCKNTLKNCVILYQNVLEMLVKWYNLGLLTEDFSQRRKERINEDSHTNINRKEQEVTSNY